MPNALSRALGLGGRRGRPGPARRRQPAAEVRNGAAVQHQRLRFADFDAEASHIADEERLIASFMVPRQTVVRFTPEPMRLYLRARSAEVDLTNDSNTSEQVDLSTLDPAINAVRSNRGAPSFPTQKHPDVAAETSTDGGSTWSAADVTAFDADANTVTVAKPADTSVKARFYVLSADGQVRFAALAPAGSGARERQIYNHTLAGMHEADQASGEAALKLAEPMGGAFLLTQQFRLGLYVTSGPKIVWDAASGHEVSIPTQRRAVRVNDAGRLVEETVAELER